MARPQPSSIRLAGLLAGLVLLLSLAPAAGADTPGLLDYGRFTVSKDGQAVRAEDFAFQRLSDSLVVRAASGRWAEKPADVRADKRMILVMGALDFAPGSYWSQLAVGRDTLRRGITVSASDTVFTAWRDVNGGGGGEIFAMPAGRLYMLDPPLFTLFGVIGWSLQGRECDHRPIRAMVLGARDTLVEATVTDAGMQDLVWHGQSVKARKLVIADQMTTITAWFTSDGHMLRLEQPQGGLVVERDETPPDAEPARQERPAPAK